MAKRERKWFLPGLVALLVCVGGVGLGWGAWMKSHPKPEASRVTEEWDGEVWGYADRNGVDLGGEDWNADLGKEGYRVWVPELALRGPWRDGRRPLPGKVFLLEEALPHGFRHPSIHSLWLELHMESYLGRGEGLAIADNPKRLEEVLPEFKSAYFHIPEIDLYGPREEKKKGSKPVSSKSGSPPERTEVSVNMREAKRDFQHTEGRDT
jgi:hypothetical protein